MKDKIIQIGTRKSKLALWQAENIQLSLLKAGLKSKLIPIETKGDKTLGVSIAKIGSKGVFTEELEQMLVSGEIDIAVHSAKDLPSTLPDGFGICSFGEREDPSDVLISESPIESIDQVSGLKIGTSSTRRIAILKSLYPAVSLVDMRGNLNTRIAKMRSGNCDVLILAYAGVKRLGLSDLIQLRLSIEDFTPPAGQGSIAIEFHENSDPKLIAAIRKTTNHPETEHSIVAERAYLSAMNGGCSIPIFAHARIQGDRIMLTAGIISLDGAEQVKMKLTGSDPLQVGTELAEKVLENNGKAILDKINEEFKTQ